MKTEKVSFYLLEVRNSQIKSDIYKRWNDHCKCGLGIDTPPGNKLYKAIQEDGLENFTFELLAECPKDELDSKEKYFIELYQAKEYGYNGTGGNK